MNYAEYDDNDSRAEVTWDDQLFQVRYDPFNHSLDVSARGLDLNAATGSGKQAEIALFVDLKRVRAMIMALQYGEALYVDTLGEIKDEYEEHLKNHDKDHNIEGVTTDLAIALGESLDSPIDALLNKVKNQTKTLSRWADERRGR